MSGQITPAFIIATLAFALGIVSAVMAFFAVTDLHAEVQQLREAVSALERATGIGGAGYDDSSDVTP